VAAEVGAGLDNFKILSPEEVQAERARQVAETEARARREPVRAQAEDLHEEYGVPVRQLHACLGRLIDTFQPDLRDRPSALADALRHHPLTLLADSLDALPAEQAVRLIRTANLHDLARRVPLGAWLLASETPLYNLSELGDNLRAFVKFLGRHRDYLVRTGLPPEPFRPSPWVYGKLGRLYPTRATRSALPHAERFTHSRRAKAPPPHQWVQTPRDRIEGCDFRTCDYDKADFLKGLSSQDGGRIEAGRARVFDLKVRLLERAARALARKSAAGLWDDCVAAISGGLTRRKVAFYLRMDASYRAHGSASGGLADLLAMVGHVEQELTTGMIASARAVLADEVLGGLHALLEAGTLETIYLATVGRAEQHHLDEAIDALAAREAEAASFWEAFCCRVEGLTRGSRVEVPIGILPTHLSEIAPRLEGFRNHLEERLDRGESLDSPFVSVARKPVWDPDRRELHFNGRVIRKIRRYTKSHLDLVMESFQEMGWPCRIDDPTPPMPNQVESEKRYEIVKSLNKGLTAIAFFTDGKKFGWRVQPREE
jgi:hypothetical protein